MNVQLKIGQKLGELFTTAKGGAIQEFVVTASDGTADTCKLHASAKDIGFLTALKSGDVITAQMPEKFFFLKA